jgi:hypothetical protein
MRQLIFPAEGKVEPKLEERLRRLAPDLIWLFDLYFLPGSRIWGRPYRLAG